MEDKEKYNERRYNKIYNVDIKLRENKNRFNERNSIEFNKYEVFELIKYKISRLR